MAGYRPVIGPEMSEKTARALLYRLGADAWRDRVLIAWARSEAALRADERADEGWPELCALPERWSAPVFPLKGQDLMDHGMKPGPQLGRTLQALEDRWIASDFTIGREELLHGLSPDAPS
jgi:poly(A) polymerase